MLKYNDIEKQYKRSFILFREFLFKKWNVQEAHIVRAQFDEMSDDEVEGLFTKFFDSHRIFGYESYSPNGHDGEYWGWKIYSNRYYFDNICYKDRYSAINIRIEESFKLLEHKV